MEGPHAGWEGAGDTAWLWEAGQHLLYGITSETHSVGGDSPTLLKTQTLVSSNDIPSPLQVEKNLSVLGKS